MYVLERIYEEIRFEATIDGREVKVRAFFLNNDEPPIRTSALRTQQQLEQEDLEQQLDIWNREYTPADGQPDAYLARAIAENSPYTIVERGPRDTTRRKVVW